MKGADEREELARRWPKQALPRAGQVSVAKSAAELEAIGRLRYDLYVERDQKAYAHADHVRRCLLEPVDDVSLNFQVKQDDRLLAAVRVTWAPDALLDLHLRPLVEGARIACLSTAVVNSRFVVRPELRARAVIVPLFCEVYRTGMLAGATCCVIGTRSDLVGIFERFGFRETGFHIRDPIAGRIHNLNLNPYDLAHLKKVASPLLTYAEKLVCQSRTHTKLVTA
ncbi:N-acyl amino acid synthase FeeM domain-containing protein [Bradyrhizobium sp. UFLA05-112]